MRFTVQETYLGFRELAHARDCLRPAWTADVREDDAYRSAYGGPAGPHSCCHEECDHGGLYQRTTLRLICFSCQAAYLLSGEGSLHRTTTRATGVGQPPRQVAGLFLWPGEPWYDEDPRAWLVTRSRTDRVRATDAVGEIHRERGPRGGRQFAAVALPSPHGPYGIGLIRWERAREGFGSVAAAAKWIAQLLAEGDEAGGPA
ncbi:hypothetical protein ACFVIM_13750 [Streptomyces sp. NPDC057638]|uniref:hypothetical protein n=1 Tax=Streptomyces sp. NPDC057638 TaxID=3346190 RepID=UPI0036CFDE77